MNTKKPTSEVAERIVRAIQYAPRETNLYGFMEKLIVEALDAERETAFDHWYANASNAEKELSVERNLPPEFDKQTVSEKAQAAYIKWNGAWDSLQGDEAIVTAKNMSMGMRHCYLVGFEHGYSDISTRCVEVSEKELHDLAAHEIGHWADINGEAFDAYRKGFRKAQELRAVRAWPSDEEIKDVAKHEDSDGYFGFLSGCRWLKATMTEENSK